jgi:dipeptidyl aminopeptidase/acylaminoacyl peptidase
VTPFDDLHDYMALPRLTGLRLSPDGDWLAATVAALSPDGRTFKPSIWRIPARPGQARPAARLTRSAEGEDNPAFLPDGSLVFLSARPAPPDGPASEARAAGPSAGQPGPAQTGPAQTSTAPASTGHTSTGHTGTGQAATGQPGPAPGNGTAGKRALWLLPADGGEACQLTAPPGGISRLATAAAAPLAAFTCPVLPGASGIADDAQRRKDRADAGVTAILHEAAPVRHWDHDLGPDQLRLLVTVAGPDAADCELATAELDGGSPRDLTSEPGRALDEHHFELTPDGRFAVTGWSVFDGCGGLREEVAVIDTRTGTRRTLLSAPDADFSSPRISPDGRSVLAIRSAHDTIGMPGDVTLMLAPLDGSAGPADLLAVLDRWPAEAAWAPDSGSVFFTADDEGRRPVFRAELGPAGRRAAAVTRLTTDDGAYTSLCPAPDGRYVYALRAAVDSPPAAVRLDASQPGEPEFLAGPAGPPPLPGRLTEIATTASDGTVLRAWLVLPAAAAADSPAPLLLWVHGGPLSSWNTWSWRWNPWLMAARGYAVLLPDPALSTGYGLDFIARGHGEWGDRPFTDLMAITDAAVARPDIDEGRTGMMGGSFGGYMANWIAGHTDRFRAIVSHASLWALDQVFGTTDSPVLWRRLFGTPQSHPDRYSANSPHLHAAEITTPMLIIHGDRDYRVPIGEALRMWADLAGGPSGQAGAKFLYFPDENHWVLTPGNATIWYETVLAFMAQHVLGEPWRRPALL